MWFSQDRRQKDRRQEGVDNAAPVEQESREQDRRQVQRRACFRVVYPTDAAPKITNLPLRVIDISIKAVRFTPCGELADGALEDGKRIQMVFKFNDDQVVEFGGVIFRHSTDSAGREVYVCRFNRELPAELVNSEQAFLLKNYPDFCRQVRR
ncbi:MAG TPA: hypothetical protein DDW84_01240 [Phycisphaerales bacterium]|nr:hypothetical protein [Phycisphaerales bacterium]HBR20945.1 hypothetical protein [Phycisphaerales bacterium]